MNWDRHYTGHETWNPRGNGMGWYINRNTNTKSWTFIRWSCRGVNLCAFLGYTNYLKEVGCWGIELSADIRHLPNVRVGIALPERWNPLWWKLNPTYKPMPRRLFAYHRSLQWGHVAIRLGWFAFGFNLPQRVNDWINKRRWEREDRMMEAYWAQHEADHGEES